MVIEREVHAVDSDHAPRVQLVLRAGVEEFGRVDLSEGLAGLHIYERSEGQSPVAEGDVGSDENGVLNLRQTRFWCSK